MSGKDKAFQEELMAAFKDEAKEHLRVLSEKLIELEKNKSKKKSTELVESLFREAHSLKGASRSAGVREIESVCHVLESIFSALKNAQISLSIVQFDLIHQAVDNMGLVVPTAGKEQTSADRSHARKLIENLKSILPEEKKTEKVATRIEISNKENSISDQSEQLPPQSKSTSQKIEEMPIQADSVRIPISKLDPLLFQSEEMIHSVISFGQHVKELHEINREFVSWKKESKKWKDRRKYKSTPQFKSLLEWNDSHLSSLENRVTSLSHLIKQDYRTLSRKVDEHLDSTKKILMLPVESLSSILPKIVRDLAREQNKEVEFTIRGSEIEIDKRILSELKDPLIHLIRNCIDHGIEKSEERSNNKKPSHGNISLTFTALESRQIEIVIADDGAGIDIEKVLSTAVKSGFISTKETEKLDTNEKLALIFHSGITTSSIVTNISGRGLGLAIVREKVEKLGGAVTVDSQKYIGTTFKLVLPLTLSTFRGVIIKADQQEFIIPTMQVQRIKYVNKNEITTVENKETILIDNRVLSLVRLGDVLSLPTGNILSTPYVSNQPGFAERILVVVLSSSDKLIAFQIDEILDEYQVLVKDLGRQLKRVRNISGAAVLGTGKVVPVINVSDLIKSALQSGSGTKQAAEITDTHAKRGKILIAEDSITSRILIKTILENGGYQVATAVDGAEAFTQLFSSDFDLLVSDVDMPRMNGFELTAKIRSNKKFGELPIVLVTALESHEDKERGIEVGANAYIVKSNFDESNLLEVVQKLI